MSNVITTPFPIKQTNDGRFAVHIDDNIVIVQTRQEADLLASISVEHSKTFTDVPGKPDAARVRKILQVCEDYRYNSHVPRQLEQWLKRQRLKA